MSTFSVLEVLQTMSNTKQSSLRKQEKKLNTARYYINGDRRVACFAMQYGQPFVSLFSSFSLPCFPSATNSRANIISTATGSSILYG